MADTNTVPATASTDSIEGLSTLFKETLVNHGVSHETAVLTGTIIAGVCLVLVALLAYKIINFIVVRTVHRLIAKTEAKWDDALIESKLIQRFMHLVPAIIISTFNARVFADAPAVASFADSFVNLYIIAIAVGVIFSAFDTVHLISQRTTLLSGMPLKGVIQAGKLVIALIAAILVLSILLGKSPVYFLSGIGALAAVLMMIFKDAILGFTGGIMLAANKMVSVGDWIEMPSAGADGDVIDVSLTTVKVRNFDNTIVTIPAYSLASGSFKNWRGMSESGGRRIKRSIKVDMKTIRFADEKILEHWRHIELLKPYLDAKQKEIDEENKKKGCDLSVLGNGRCLTNLGTFRAYCEAYLRAHANIHKKMTLMVRQLDPTEKGIPLELYTFTSDVRWVQYEGIQADIFDHLLAIIGEFGLSVYQNPSSEDVREFKSAVVMKG
ncbi:MULTISPECIES: mechanosensitive ion channel domain-containing protein [unclassified Ereboglobus]|uniref:mechanosensitive ion channel family protein n=1 Tax=unclassified Ereboglobus TaxID=2626932 RepID=UPI002404BFC0|nr:MULTISPECIES: mechanosensitive ion channel domain-containing protein [unclassified Ereboglobus]